jgi:hypothetical protein
MVLEPYIKTLFTFLFSYFSLNLLHFPDILILGCFNTDRQKLFIGLGKHVKKIDFY